MDSELDRLAQELMATRREASADGGTLESWLTALRGEHGSDLFLVAGIPPAIKVDGTLRFLAGAPLDGEEIEEAMAAALPAAAVARFRKEGVVDASVRRSGLGRFRVNLHRERGRAAATIRAIPLQPPEVRDLALPDGIERLAHLKHGLVLIGGAAGSGKTTTVAGLVNAINTHDAKHIVTIEDPIEYDHPHRRSVVEQVEIGVDAPDFPTALRAVVRQAPDVIVVGEMRDPETMQIAVAAAETGHLVLSTLHTTDVAATVARISDAFPPERQSTIRQELAMALAAVATQTLVPTAVGTRMPAVELLMVSYGARQHIRRNALQHLHQEITSTRALGSFTLDECLAELVRTGRLGRDDALAHAQHVEELSALLSRIGA